MHGRRAATVSPNVPSAAVRTRKSVYARVVGDGVVASSSASPMPNSSAYERWRSISTVTVDSRRSANVPMWSSVDAFEAPSANSRLYSIR